MWKLLIVSAVLMQLVEAQRSPYAGRPGYRSKLLAKYNKNKPESSLETRGGEEEESSTPLPSELQGTIQDHKLVHRVSKWPKDKQPFWFKNKQAILAMRQREIDGENIMFPSFNSNQRPRPQFQSPFQRPGRGRGVGWDNGRGRPNEASLDDEFKKIS